MRGPRVGGSKRSLGGSSLPRTERLGPFHPAPLLGFLLCWSLGVHILWPRVQAWPDPNHPALEPTHRPRGEPTSGYSVFWPVCLLCGKSRGGQFCVNPWGSCCFPST